MNNLEALLADHDSDLFNALDCCHCVYSYNDGLYCRADITESKCDYDDCERGHREWLLAEHVDDESCRQDADQPKREESPDCESDSREKLKSDAYQLMCDTWNKGLMFAKRPYEDIPLDAVMWKFGDILALLDRQAAITERETEKKWSCFSDSVDGHIAELTNQLESAHAKNRALKAHIAKMQEGRHGWHIKGKELQQQVDTMRDVIREFRDERDHYIELFHEQERRANELQLRDANLAREIGTLRAERDRYRELCGKLLDAADDMRRVRDAFDQFGKVDR